MEPDRLVIVLRALLYAGCVASAGGVLFSLSFQDVARQIERSLKRQVLIGCWLILLVEPLRYLAFQFTAAEGDWSAAFAPGMRWMGMETGFGKAAAVRAIAAATMIATKLRWRGVSAAAAVAMIASFALEGHTVSSGSRVVLAPLLLLHVAAICWWLGALYPLLVILRRTPPEVGAATIRTFGRRALWIVGALLIAGALQLISLTGGELILDNEYQQRFARKLMLVAILLAFAAWNKLRLTPLLEINYAAGARKLRRSIKAEIAIAALILAATAWIITVSPHA